MTNRFHCVILSFVVFLSLYGCATPPVYTPHKDKSYVVRGHNYSFAVYNGEHRLLTHPVEDLLTEMKWRKTLGNLPCPKETPDCRKPKQISDIYVVSHGWNFTLSTAIANYHNYMERIDKMMEKIDKQGNNVDPKKFQPYFIFVTWTSTTRPTTDLAKAVLPFGIDSVVEPVTNLVDKVPLHLLTTWKQSINASHNALGSKFPNDYLEDNWTESAYGFADTNLFQDADATMGEDVPVSALIYKLIQQKQISTDELNKKNADQQNGKPIPNCNQPDPIDPKDDVCVPLNNTKIHLVGHSYGAKLVSLAGMEALRRWMLDHIDKNQKSCDKANKCKTNEKPLSKTNLAVSSITGHRKALLEAAQNLKECVEETLNIKKAEIPTLLHKLYVNESATLPINSMVLFNPALRPGELSYPVDDTHLAPTDTLRFIPRKAIVYTTHDYALGAIFTFRETLLNTELTQWGHNEASAMKRNFEDSTKDMAWYGKYPWLLGSKIQQAMMGPLTMGLGVAATQPIQGVKTVLNIPSDFLYHVQNGTLDGWYDSPNFKDNPDLDDSFVNFGKGFINGIDFFLPIKLSRIWSPKQGWDCPFFWSRDEIDQGLFRLSSPGLGKVGINNSAEGRCDKINLRGLSAYYSEKEPFITEHGKKTNQVVPEQFLNLKKELQQKGKLEEFRPFAPNIDAHTFCRFAAKPKITDKKVLEMTEQERKDELWKREKFYSFDASHVFDRAVPEGVGAHSDLRDVNPPDEGSCWNPTENEEGLGKRDYTMNFVINFTQSDFEQELCDVSQGKKAKEELEKQGISCNKE